MTSILFSTDQDAPLGAQLDRVRSLAPLPPFAPILREFAREFSKRVFRLPEVRQHPELATLAHWFRGAAVEHLADQASQRLIGVARARGTVFHLAPANVDVLFAYAWLMSVLCGNVNVARLSQRQSDQRDALLGILKAMHSEGQFQEVLERTLFLTYPHDDAITRQISQVAHARIVWGGDATVARIRAIPLAPLALELVFPDRFGVAAIHAASLFDVPVETLQELARRFCNDVLWFGQQACSSPRTLYWVGTPDNIQRAKAVFWPTVRAEAKRFDDEPAAVMGRVADAFLLATLDGNTRVEGGLGAYPLTLEAVSADASQREVQSGYGLIVEMDVHNLADLAARFDDRDQTLVQHGFSHDDLRTLLGLLHNRAIDRIVPIGRALDFHHVWDGVDFFAVLMRQVTLPGQ